MIKKYAIAYRRPPKVLASVNWQILFILLTELIASYALSFLQKSILSNVQYASKIRPHVFMGPDLHLYCL